MPGSNRVSTSYDLYGINENTRTSLYRIEFLFTGPEMESLRSISCLNPRSRRSMPHHPMKAKHLRQAIPLCLSRIPDPSWGVERSWRCRTFELPHGSSACTASGLETRPLWGETWAPLVAHGASVSSHLSGRFLDVICCLLPKDPEHRPVERSEECGARNQHSLSEVPYSGRWVEAMHQVRFYLVVALEAVQRVVVPPSRRVN